MTAGESRRLRFPVTIFLSAFLLFQVQPIVARYLLPGLEGAPRYGRLASCSFRQCCWPAICTRTGFAALWIHIGLLAVSLLFLPAAPRAEAWQDVWKPTAAGDPSLRILLLLAATVGAPYFLLSSTAPSTPALVHRSEPVKSPWRLYALSNFGSFLALLSYPFAVEPFVSLRTQSGSGRGSTRCSR